MICREEKKKWLLDSKIQPLRASLQNANEYGIYLNDLTRRPMETHLRDRGRDRDYARCHQLRPSLKQSLENDHVRE